MTDDKTLIIEGVTLSAADADGRSWTYLPSRPLVERTPSGEPMFSIIEAGPVAFLQCTARLALHEDVRAHLLESLKTVQPDAERLEPAGIAVGRIALEVNTGDRWEAIGESAGSGMPPWNAAFAVTLTPAALAALKAAAAGESGHARLSASYTAVVAPAVYRLAASTSATKLETPAGTLTTGHSTTTEEVPHASGAHALAISADMAIELSSAGGGNR